MARTRSSKKLSQRIDREYFKRLYPIPRWRRLLSLAFTVLGLLWVFSSSLLDSGSVYSAGPLSKAHHILEANCESCHTGTALWGRKVEEKACLTCHDGPQHKVQQASNPSCTSCHVDHKGGVALASMVGDASCVQCHGNLQTKDGKLTVAANVTDFGTSHPEFALLKNKTPDPGTIKFGHQVHMKADLRGPKGPAQLKCANCHVIQNGPAVNGVAANMAMLPESALSGIPGNPADTVPGSAMSKGVMSVANFKEHCESCHPLEFNRHLSERLPHDKPEVALAFARQALTAFIAANPQWVNVVEPALDPKIMAPRLGPAGTQAEWVRRAMEDTETLMWRKTCIECHTPKELSGDPAGGAHEIPKAQITTTWFTGARFDHMGHQTVGCTECHSQAKDSKLTSDVMLPGIEKCQGCHRTQNPSASANCTECHVYHDWSKAKPIDTERTIRELLNR